jgi:hypothetical protein
VAETSKLGLLAEAIRRVGLETVAAELRSPADLVQRWTRGQAAMPDRKVIPVVDLLDRINKA